MLLLAELCRLLLFVFLLLLILLILLRIFSLCLYPSFPDPSSAARSDPCLSAPGLFCSGPSDLFDPSDSDLSYPRPSCSDLFDPDPSSIVFLVFVILVVPRSFLLVLLSRPFLASQEAQGFWIARIFLQASHTFLAGFREDVTARNDSLPC